MAVDDLRSRALQMVENGECSSLHEAKMKIIQSYKMPKIDPLVKKSIDILCESPKKENVFFRLWKKAIK